MPKIGRWDFYSFVPNTSYPGYLSAGNKPAEISSLGELLGQTDIVCIRSKITQSTIKTTKTTAESTNMSCSSRNAFYHRTKMDKREVLFSVLPL